MQLHLQRNADANSVTSYGPGYFVVNETRIHSSIIIGPEVLDASWSAASVDDIVPAVIEELLTHSPEVILIGSGDRHRFPAASVMSMVAQARVGLEVMTTGAACRTYSVLLSEGRAVIALLLRTASEG